MTDREKLMNMIRIGRACPGSRDPFGEHCETCHYFDSKECDVERVVDHLLANGVTFATDNNVGGNPVVCGHDNLYNISEMSYNNGYAKGLEDGKPKWISVEERLPEHGEIILCRLIFDELRILQWDNVGKWWLGYGTGDDWRQNDVTHWMPLPEQPKTE